MRDPAGIPTLLDEIDRQALPGLAVNVICDNLRPQGPGGVLGPVAKVDLACEMILCCGACRSDGRT
ncbi:hypothetical protein NLX86_33370, partial [Streptomyces sp. A3M-1-3]|uniref:hypothetical protein n=1 Tax=Streptomyces sp. A3M-1-3 TaxID=2962044 RepID=UPI0020B7DE83